MFGRTKKARNAYPQLGSGFLKIGIPRALYYYTYPGLWESFFKEIGLVPVVSAPSNRRTVERAAAISEAEHCLPNKLLDAHVDKLLDSVDALFVPRTISMQKGFIACPKLGALPDAVSAEVAAQKPVLVVDIDETKMPLRQTLIGLAQQLGSATKVAKKATDRAFATMREKRQELTATPHRQGVPRFLLLGHPYIVHDPFICGMVLDKLRRMPVNLELLSYPEGSGEGTPILWCMGAKLFQKITAIKPGEYAGIIQVSAFNCGCDSMLIDTYRFEIEKKKIPYLVLILDEHSGQVGLETRLEAFIDSTGW
jgi:predicted nucleotide-binding protein (sugar kinase/HSP70/actin superfamily)